MPRSQTSPSALSRRIAQAIASSGKSQRELARAMRVNEQQVSRWANGKRVPDAVMLARLCIATEVDGEWLLTGRGRPPRL